MAVGLHEQTGAMSFKLQAEYDDPDCHVDYFVWWPSFRFGWDWFNFRMPSGFYIDYDCDVYLDHLFANVTLSPSDAPEGAEFAIQPRARPGSGWITVAQKAAGALGLEADIGHWYDLLDIPVFIRVVKILRGSQSVGDRYAADANGDGVNDGDAQDVTYEVIASDGSVIRITVPSPSGNQDYGVVQVRLPNGEWENVTDVVHIRGSVGKKIDIPMSPGAAAAINLDPESVGVRIVSLDEATVLQPNMGNIGGGPNPILEILYPTGTPGVKTVNGPHLLGGVGSILVDAAGQVLKAGVDEIISITRTDTGLVALIGGIGVKVFVKKGDSSGQGEGETGFGVPGDSLIPLYKSAYDPSRTSYLRALPIRQPGRDPAIQVRLERLVNGAKVNVYNSAVAGSAALADSQLSWPLATAPDYIYFEGESLSGVQDDIKMRLVYSYPVDGQTQEFPADFSATVFDIALQEVSVPSVAEGRNWQYFPLTRWSANESERIRYPGGSNDDPIWKSDGSLEMVICGMKGSIINLTAKIVITPADLAANGVDAKVFDGEEVLATTSGLSIGPSGRIGPITFSAIPGSDEFGKTIAALSWSIGLPGGPLLSVGEMPLRAYWTHDIPDYNAMLNTTNPSDTRLYDQALEKLEHYLELSGSDIFEKVAQGISGDLYYDVLAIVGFTHPLDGLTSNASCACTELSSAYRYILASGGFGTGTEFAIWGGAFPTEVSEYKEISSRGELLISFQCDRPAIDAEPANPRFVFHSVVKIGSQYYDAAYGMAGLPSIIEAAPADIDAAPTGNFPAGDYDFHPFGDFRGPGDVDRDGDGVLEPEDVDWDGDNQLDPASVLRVIEFGAYSSMVLGPVSPFKTYKIVVER